MPIELLEKDIITVPATQEEVAPLMWIESLNFFFPDPLQESTVNMRFFAMTTGGKVIRNINGVDVSKNIHSSNFYADIEECPELKAAFDAIIIAVPAYGKMLANKAAAREALQKAAEDARKAAEEANAALNSI